MASRFGKGNWNPQSTGFTETWGHQRGGQTLETLGQEAQKWAAFIDAVNRREELDTYKDALVKKGQGEFDIQDISRGPLGEEYRKLRQPLDELEQQQAERLAADKAKGIQSMGLPDYQATYDTKKKALQDFLDKIYAQEKWTGGEGFDRPEFKVIKGKYGEKFYQHEDNGGANRRAQEIYLQNQVNPRELGWQELEKLLEDNQTKKSGQDKTLTDLSRALQDFALMRQALGSGAEILETKPFVGISDEYLRRLQQKYPGVKWNRKQ